MLQFEVLIFFVGLVSEKLGFILEDFPKLNKSDHSTRWKSVSDNLFGDQIVISLSLFWPNSRVQNENSESNPSNRLMYFVLLYYGVFFSVSQKLLSITFSQEI